METNSLTDGLEPDHLSRHSYCLHLSEQDLSIFRITSNSLIPLISHDPRFQATPPASSMDKPVTHFLSQTWAHLSGDIPHLQPSFSFGLSHCGSPTRFIGSGTQVRYPASLLTPFCFLHLVDCARMQFQAKGT